MSDQETTILVVSGPEGPSVYIDNYRVAGPKPWGGGEVIHEFKGVQMEDLRRVVVNHGLGIPIPDQETPE